eukprot:TRINITY_DN4512_c0_g1_i3.p1 TRINITY_DN4512_c0_g1~~TRINITY_DN4512_c0_g1_i3.p1  ORF type:complete len:274 (-),score=47.40 TRINITY_DN4512_c0_g1_i3:337-1158(-)
MASPTPVNRKTHPLAARIKRLMQADEGIGKIAQSTPLAISKAVELLLLELSYGGIRVAQREGVRTVSAGHLFQVPLMSPEFRFLLSLKSEQLEEEAGRKPATTGHSNNQSNKRRSQESSGQLRNGMVKIPKDVSREGDALCKVESRPKKVPRRKKEEVKLDNYSPRKTDCDVIQDKDDQPDPEPIEHRDRSDRVDKQNQSLQIQQKQQQQGQQQIQQQLQRIKQQKQKQQMQQKIQQQLMQADCFQQLQSTRELGVIGQMKGLYDDEDDYDNL